ncbi:TSUP family transporter [Streptomyces alkaliterrae]|uniref:Probable membrane transporter protein n=1 Tax=Streptomyces alkaliterrae TaxID=2213162 RepID=A0A5P0YVM0_9ACTN|nr:TSUP family transporter [Streptomyces alkaliterrae]MQS04344.1 TSUP family transporter [Streptomyces alkaliterrae]
MSALLLALAAGAAVGLALGALGGGGGILAVPALIYLLDFTPAAATTAALFIVATTSATALYAHARDGQVAWRTAALFSAAGVVPAYLAGAAAGDLPATALTVAFALVALTARAGGGAGVDWAVVAPFTGAAVLAAWDGRRLAAKVSAVALRRIFAGVLLAVAAFMLVGTLV